MVNFVIKLGGGQIQGENAGDASLHAVFRRNEITAGVVAHGVNGNFAVAVFVHLRNHISKRKVFECFAVAKHRFVSHFFSYFETKWVIVVQVPIAGREVQPRLHARNIHPSVRDGSNRPVDFACRDVRAFDEEFALNIGGAAVRDVEDRELGQTAGAPRTIGFLPAHGIDHRMI